MAHRIDWDNIHLHIHDTEDRYKRRLRRKQLYIECSPSISPDAASSKKLKTVENQEFMGNHEVVVALACPNVVSNVKPIRVEGNDADYELEMLKEDLREGEKSLGCKVDDNASDDLSLKKIEIQGQKLLCNNVDPDLEMLKDGSREGGLSLVCKVDDNASDDFFLKKFEYVEDRKFLCNDVFWVECSNVVRNPEPIGAICGTREDAVDPDLEMFEEDLKKERHLFASSVVGIKKLGNVQDQYLRNDELRVNCSDSDVKFGAKKRFVDPDYKKFLKDVKVDGHSFSLKVKKNDGSLVYLEYEKDVLRKEYHRELMGDNVKNVPGKQRGGTAKYLRNNIRKEKTDEVVRRDDVIVVSSKERRNVMLRRDGFSGNLNRSTDEVVPRDDVIVVSSKERRNVMLQRDGFSGNLNRSMDEVVPRDDVFVVSRKERRNVMLRRDGFSGNLNRSSVAKRSSVVKRKDNIEILSIGKPIQIEEVTVGKNNRPSKIISNKRQRPLNLDDERDIEHLRQSKKKCEKVERRPCLTRTDHVSNLMDIAGKSKRHHRKTRPSNERRDLAVLQGVDIENSRFSLGIGNMDGMVKEEKFDASTDAVVKKRRQMVEGRESVCIYDDNLQPRYKCDKKFVKYAEVKEENVGSVNYDEEDNEHSSDLEILDMDNQQNSRKFEVMKVFNASVREDYPPSMDSPRDYENSEFRKELMDILRRPYNREEYKSLMEKGRYRHLLGGPEYSDGLKGKNVSNIYGKSPLDYHPDVQKRLRQCRKISRRLNILRGFIYWYERACQSGAFKPWLDKSCSAVAPSSC